MQIKAVIFDMDGVIFDGEAVWKKAHKAANKTFHIHVSEKIRVSLCGRKESDCRKLLKNLFPSLDVDAYRDYMSDLVDSQVKKGVPLKNKKFASLINSLKQHGFQIALATGTKKTRTKLSFEKAGLNLEEIFDAVVTGDDVKVSKPDPEIYLTACKKLGLAPENCFAIEDSPNGIMSAHSAGCRTIMVIDLIKPNSEIKSKCEKVFKKLDKAVDYILKQNKKTQ